MLHSVLGPWDTDTDQSSWAQVNLIKNNLFEQFLLAISLTKIVSSLLSYKTNAGIKCSLFYTMKVKVIVAQSCLNLCHPWTVVHQAPLSMGFPRQEYWSGLPFPPPGDLPNPGNESSSPALLADSLPSDPPITKACKNLLGYWVTWSCLP